MTPSNNVEMVRGLFAYVETKQLDKLAEYVGVGFQRHDLVGAYPGVDEGTVVDFLSEVIRGVPDIRLNIQDIFGEGDRVVVRFKLEGTHEGELFGQPGSGKTISVNAINIYRVAEGKIAETWQLQDLAGFMSQIGA